MISKIVLSVVCFAVMDGLWFHFFMKQFAIESLSDHLSIRGSSLNTHYGYALIAYLFMVLLSAFFLGPKVMPVEGYLKVFMWGALFGVCVFGVFDFTNAALMKNYPLKFAVIDTFWGGVMYGTAALLMKKFAS